MSDIEKLLNKELQALSKLQEKPTDEIINGGIFEIEELILINKNIEKNRCLTMKNIISKINILIQDNKEFLDITKDNDLKTYISAKISAYETIIKMVL